MLLNFLNSYVLNCTYSYPKEHFESHGWGHVFDLKSDEPTSRFSQIFKSSTVSDDHTKRPHHMCDDRSRPHCNYIVIIITIIGLVNRRKHYKELKHYTVTPSFQIAKVHPPTVRSISLKKGDLCRVVMGPSCANHTCSGRGAKEKRQFTFIICSCSKQN